MAARFGDRTRWPDPAEPLAPPEYDILREPRRAQRDRRNRTIATALTVVAIVALGGILRFQGLGWELPNALHESTYHPDELLDVRAMMRVNPFHFSASSLNPEFFDYPSGYINLGSAAIRCAQALGLHVHDNWAEAYLVARIVTATLGVLTILAVFWAGVLLYGSTVGTVAALVFAVVPLHVMHSHFATVDVPATFWLALALVGAAAIARPTEPPLRSRLIGSGSFRRDAVVSAFAGFVAGLAGGTKYNTVLVFASIVTAHFIRHGIRNWRTFPQDRLLWISIVALVVGGVCTSPGLFFFPGEYWQGFHYDMQKAQIGHGHVFEGRGPGWLDVLRNSMAYGLGFYLLAFALAAFLLAVVSRKRADWMLLAFLVPYFMLLASSKIRFARYSVPLIPVIAILVARFMVDVQRALKQTPALVRGAWAVISIAAVVYTGMYAAGISRLFVLPDPRTRAAEWFFTNVKPGTSIGMPMPPWFWSPPLATRITCTPQREARYRLTSESRYAIVSAPDSDWSRSILERNRPRYVVTSDYEFEDPLRLKLPETLDYFASLNRDYVRVKTFRNDISFLGIPFGPTTDLPHDCRYMAPTLFVYERVAPHT
jgi:dolichyl-phosphate-mannose-protein mannosyltransferase